MARKREEKANKDTRKTKSRSPSGSSCQDKNFLSLKQQLAAMKLILREIPGDGNCLFGALADQLDGTPKTHVKHRQEVVTYMRNHREDFEPFVEDDEPFEKHLSNLAELGTYGGNECIVAFARLNGVKVVIHQLNTPLWQIDGSNGNESARELHISYHNGDHYNSVRRTGDSTSNPSNIKLSASRGTPNSSYGTASRQVKNSSGPDSASKKKYSKPFDDEEKGGGFSVYYESACEPYNDTVDGVVACSTDSAITQNCQFVMERTGCEDVETIQHFLVANDHDVNLTVDALLNYIIHDHKGEEQMTVPPCWDLSEDESPSYGRVSRSDSFASFKETKKSMHELRQEKLKSGSLSSAKRKELKKQIRKHQRNEKKRHQNENERMNQNENYSEENCSSWGSSDDHSETIIVRDICCLSI